MELEGDPLVGNSLSIAREETRLKCREARLTKPKETEGGSSELLLPELRMPSFLSAVSGSGATNTEWAKGLVGDLSPGEEIEGHKPPPDPVVMDVNNGEERCGTELGVVGVDFPFEVALEFAVNEHWISRAVVISESSPLHRKEGTARQCPTNNKEDQKKNTNSLPFWTLGSGTFELVVLNPEKLLDRGQTPAALGKTFARGTTPPPGDSCSGAEDGGGTCTEPGLVNEIPGAAELAPPFPFSPDIHSHSHSTSWSQAQSTYSSLAGLLV